MSRFSGKVRHVISRFLVLLSTFELAENVEWMERSSVKFPPRYEHGSLLCSSRGLLYVFGGARTEGPLGDLWKYDIGQLITVPACVHMLLRHVI